MDTFRVDPPWPVARTPRLIPGYLAPSLLRGWDHGLRPAGDSEELASFRRPSCW